MLTGKNIKLRALEPDDVEDLYRWENDSETWKVSNTLAPFSRHVIEQYVANAHQDIYTTKQLRLMICTTEGRKIGCIDLFDFDPYNKRAGVGILIADGSDRRKGYASEALEVLIKYAFGLLNLHQLYCNISVDNEASLNLFQKHHFVNAGLKKDWLKDGDAWLDEYTFQLINNL